MILKSPGAILFKNGIITLRYYGLMIALGFIMALYAAGKLARKNDINIDTLTSLSLWCFIAGIIGARLYYVTLSYSFFLAHPLEIMATWNGGLSIHGGIAGGIIAGMIFCHRHKLSLFKYADLICTCVPLGQAVGRWGNFFNSEAYGRPVSDDFFLKLYIPPECRPMSYYTYNYFHPTFLYESVWDLILFAFLYFWAYKRTKAHPGMIFGLYLSGYSLGRMFIEPLRIDSVASFAGLPVPVVASALTLIFSLCFMLHIYQKSVARGAAEAGSAAAGNAAMGSTDAKSTENAAMGSTDAENTENATMGSTDALTNSPGNVEAAGDGDTN